MTHESEKPHRSLFDDMLKHSTNPNDVYVHGGMLNGKFLVRFNYSRNPFAKTGVEIPAEVCVGTRPLTRQDLERIYAIAAQVEAAYGKDAVGALPEIPTTTTEKAA